MHTHTTHAALEARKRPLDEQFASVLPPAKRERQRMGRKLERKTTTTITTNTTNTHAPLTDAAQSAGTLTTAFAASTHIHLEQLKNAVMEDDLVRAMKLLAEKALDRDEAVTWLQSAQCKLTRAKKMDWMLVFASGFLVDFQDMVIDTHK